jgi:signal transduction histidine kinase
MSDSLAPFRQAVLVVRWGATAICLALASPEIGEGNPAVLAGLSVLLAYSAVRTLRPVVDDGGPGGMAWLLAEATLAVVLVATTGFGDSPLVFALLPPVALVGFSRGFAQAARVAVAACIGVLVPWLLVGVSPHADLRRSGQGAAEVLLVALVAGYARRISGEADERRIATLDRLGRLSDANVLLFQLHQVTQTLPASLDLTDVLDATVDQLRSLFDADGVAILLHEESDDSWSTSRRHGLAGATSLFPGELPAAVQRVLAVRSTDREDLLTGEGDGLDPRSRSGLYGLLTARGATIGVVALEHHDPHHFTERDAELLTGFVEPAAVAIDNARWFGRLRTLGADEERTRLARDLHDRTGQSLAYLAFELDRITKLAGKGDDVTEALDALRTDVRKVISELRDTLYDLRTDVTEADGLASTLEGFLTRVGERSGLVTALRAEESARLPLLRERELWRIAREAVTNVERHAQASRVDVLWRTDGRSATLEVVDDGVGIASAEGGSLSEPGVAALRERAASIGASLAVVSEPGRGTRVRCSLAG